jgi:hypothetical protein
LLEVERDYNVEVLQVEVATAIESLNDGQRAAYDGVSMHMLPITLKSSLSMALVERVKPTLKT